MRVFDRIRQVTVLLLLGMGAVLHADAPGGVDQGLTLWLDASDIDGDGVSEGYNESGLVDESDANGSVHDVSG